MFVTSFGSLPTAEELNIASHVLLQNDRYIFKALFVFSFNKYGMEILNYKAFRKYIVCQGFYLTSHLETCKREAVIWGGMLP